MASTLPTTLSSGILNHNNENSTSSKNPPLNVTKELAALKHTKSNHDLHRLPSNTTIQRRPINHPPIASPHAGAEVSKVVYISTKTPLMAAVKRVKKLLTQIEKRATQSAHARSNQRGVSGGGRRNVSFLEGMRSAHDFAGDVNDQIASLGEEVLVKASGRAMEQALKVGEWFRTREREMLCRVEIRTGSVSVVDDIVEVEPEEDGVDVGGVVGTEEGHSTSVQDQTEGDTTLELLGQPPREKSDMAGQRSTTGPGKEVGNVQDQQQRQPDGSIAPGQKQSKRKKRKRPVYDKDDLPEARLRWIKTVEVAISLRH